MKALLITIAMVLLISVPVVGEENGLHGDLSFKYELAEFFPGQSWEIDIYYRLTPWFKIGLSEMTFTNSYVTYFDIVPGFIPNNQLYEAYAVFNLGQMEIKLSQWCNHPVYSGDLDILGSPAAGFYVAGSYSF
jgi:hypothetical protein